MLVVMSNFNDMLELQGVLSMWMRADVLEVKRLLER